MPAFFLLIVGFLLSASPAFAKDCSQLMQDLAAGPQLSSEDYLPEVQGMYLPAAFCPDASRSIVMETPGRAEVRYVEQCREHGYKVLQTSLACLAAGKKAKILTRCEVDGQSFSPCLKQDLDRIFSA